MLPAIVFAVLFIYFGVRLITGNAPHLFMLEMLQDGVLCQRAYHCRCSEPLDCSDCYTKSSAIEMRIKRVLPPRPVARSDRRELSL